MATERQNVDDGGPAFPTNHGSDRFNALGLSRRDYFAAHAPACPEGFTPRPSCPYDMDYRAWRAAQWAAMYATAMLLTLRAREEHT